MLWISTRLDNSTRYQYNHKAYTISTRIMYDDYEIDYTYSNEFYAQDLDEDYARDTQDYNTLAYQHYA